MENNITVRDTIVVTRSEIGKDFLHPEQIRLKLNDRTRVHPLDIGALAYTVRQRQKNTHLANLPWLVDESSFMPARRKLLVKLHDFVATTGNSDNSVNTHMFTFFRIINWLDTHRHVEAFESANKLRGAYKAYVNELNHQIKAVALDCIMPKTANKQQLAFIKLIKLYWYEKDGSEIIREVPIIRFKDEEGVAPEEKNVRFATKTFLHLARGFKEFAMENKPFPYLLKMPDYECYIFPSNAKACVTEYTSAEHAVYDYHEGRLATPEKYMLKSKRKVTKKEAVGEIEKSNANLAFINADPRNTNRVNYVVLAMQSYMQLFILITGINSSELVQLEYDDSFTLEKDLLKNDFRAVKMRAGGREVSYHLGNRHGLTIFKEYIQFRSWILNGVECPYLFFSSNKDGGYTGDYSQMSTTIVQGVYKRIRGKFMPLTFPTITANKVRKYKTVVWNELGVEQTVIAKSLNHTQKTNQKYYAVSSPDRQKEEFGLFFESAKAASKRIPIKLVDDTTSTPSGHCDDFNHPATQEDNPPIEPDCKTQFGCLYCEHYVCHADEEDIYKLYSLLYVINVVRHMATDFNHSDALLLELSMRIQSLLTQMSEKSAEIKTLLENGREKVMDHGLLTPFWEFKLQRYEAMGVIING